MHKTVAVFTSTRADYGILFWLLKDLKIDSSIILQLLVSGSHLDVEFGETYHEIEQDGFSIDEKIPMLVNDDSKQGIIKSLSLGIEGYGEALMRLSPDVLIVLGDRYEALAVTQTAYILNIPVLHLHGGEITEGAYDDGFRHAITKLSYFHCVATTEYQKRVIQLGESPERVFNTGSLGLEHITRSDIKDIDTLSTHFKFDFSRPYFVVTFHPETLSENTGIKDIDTLISALNEFKSYNLVITYPNVDHGGREIIQFLNKYAQEQSSRVLLVKSFGHNFYHSVVKHSELVIGNSSSGIIEAPSLNVPTVNVGERQKGRVRANSVVDARLEIRPIKNAIERALHIKSGNDLSIYKNPYGSGNTANKIIDIIKYQPIHQTKSFYDIEVKL
jgi:UDP-N-acetylglucosamine 2-epimerase (non-hydrolysing)